MVIMNASNKTQPIQLIQTKKTLDRLIHKYGDDLKRSQLDIRPDYSRVGHGIGPGVGHSYEGISDSDRDFIYAAIASLNASVNDEYGALHFDLSQFVTERNAVNELDRFGVLILQDLNKLRNLQEKYKSEKRGNYPIEICLSYHEEIYNILDEIFNSVEYKEFKIPNLTNNLSSENADLKFKLYWNMRKWKYIIHLLAFFPFLFFAIWVLFHKEKRDLIGINNLIVLCAGGLITIVFTLLFNNHDSFKNSWKLLTRNSRNRLIKKEKDSFLRNLRKPLSVQNSETTT